MGVAFGACVLLNAFCDAENEGAITGCVAE